MLRLLPAAEQSSSAGVLLSDALHLRDGGEPVPFVFGCETQVALVCRDDGQDVGLGRELMCPCAWEPHLQSSVLLLGVHRLRAYCG